MNQFINQKIIADMQRAIDNPRQCNMFPKKPCTLMTCSYKGRCLWTEEEVKAIESSTITENKQ